MGMFGASPYDPSQIAALNVPPIQPQTIAPVPMSPIPQIRPGFNGPGGLAGKLGGIGAILQANYAGNTSGLDMMRFQQQQAMEQNHWNQEIAARRDAAQQEQAFKLYELAHPPQTEFQKDYSFLGTLDPTGAQQREFVNNKVDPIHGVPTTDAAGNPGMMFVRPSQANARSAAGAVANHPPPPAAIAALRSNPQTAADFEATFPGYYASHYLGGAGQAAPRTFP